MSFWAHLMRWTSRIGTKPSDDDEIRLLKTLLVLSTVSLATLGWLWGAIYLYFDEVTAALIPWGYALLSYTSTAVFAVTGRYKLFRLSQLCIAIFLPFFLSLALGGFAPSSAVILWAVISPLGALLFADRRMAVRLFLLFVVLLAISVALEPLLSGVNNLPPELVSFLFAMNLVGASGVAFVLVYYFVTEKDRAFKRLKTTQKQLVHADKMASLGQLTAGIAHELKNPLNFVNNFSQLNTELVEELRKLVEKPSIELTDMIDDLSSNSKRIMEHGNRADSVVSRMMEHARMTESAPVTTDLNQLVESYAEIVFHGFEAEHERSSAKLDLVLDPNIPTVNVRRKELGGVIQSLVGNALDATFEQSDGAGVVQIATHLADGTIDISVSDNGPGISDEFRERIFEPFFTTKPTGQGTGLGLSLAFDVTANALGGILEVSKPVLGGATFVVRIPVTAGGQTIP